MEEDLAVAGRGGAGIRRKEPQRLRSAADKFTVVLEDRWA